MGPLVTAEHRDRVRAYIDGAEAEGARLVVDGRADERPEGFFLGCTLLDGVRPGMRVYDDEIFGPVLSVVRVDTYEEAVALVNASPYGNGVAIFTRDGGAARRFQRDVTAGHGRGQRGHPRAGGLPLLRGLEVLALRRQRHVRPRGHPLLHPAQGGHDPLARPGDQRDRPRVPPDPLTAPPRSIPGRARP